jgi:two-component system, cell cycle sensor histidine kinase and response regulator CckA
MLNHWFLTKDIPVSLCVNYHHELGLVVVSYLIAVFAAYTAFHLIDRVRAANTATARLIWLATAGLSMGFGIWAMHFIAMLAVEIPIRVHFGLLTTVLSAGFAALASAAAFHLVAQEVRSRTRLALAGVILGSGIGLMHYVGMAALSMPARIYYDPWLFALSVVVAVVLSTTALTILTVLPGLRMGRGLMTRLAGAAIMGLAIVLMHYTGMFATYFFPEPGLRLSGEVLDPQMMASVISAVALLLVGIALVAAVLNQRVERAETLLRSAINSIAEGFVIFDSDHRVIICNDAYRAMYNESADLIIPGARLEDIIRDGIAKGRYPDVDDNQEAWLAERMQLYRAANRRVEHRLSNGSWVLSADSRMSKGGFVGLRINITALKTAQAALREGEQRFRDFAELTSDWFWEQDQELRFTHVGWENPLLQRDSQAHIGKRRWEMNDTSKAPAHWARHIADVTNHRPFRDFWYDRAGPDGRVHYVSVSGVPVFHESGTFVGYRGTGRDITIEMEAEAELRQAKERAEQAETLLRDAVDSISEGFVIYDHEDRFVMCNEAYRKLYANAAALMVPGTRFRAIVQQSFVNEALADTPERLEQALAQRERQHRRATGTIEQKFSDGRWILITDRRMRNGCIAGLRMDITGLKQAQAALLESEQRLDRAQEIAGIGSWEFDAQTGRRVWSKEMYRIRGVLNDGNAPTINGLEQFTHPEDRARFYEWLAQLKGGVPQGPIEYRILRPDGQERVVVADAMPVTDELGICTRVAGTLRDITEQRQTERQLMQAQKMESVGQLTGGLAHDFNNILGAVIGHLDLAESFADAGSPVTTHCKVALEASLKGAELVKRLLAFSRRQVLFPKSTNLRDVIASLLPLVERTLGEHIQITTQWAPGLWPAIADTAQLESAILNLIVNARDAMINGGTLSIDAVNVAVGTALATSSGELPPGDYAVISVSDTGCGMPPEVLVNVFEPFFTTKGPGAGSGLGLSMVFGTMRQLGGTVHIYSEIGLGTTVKLYLPRAAAQQDTQQRPTVTWIPTGEERILLVEDNAQIRIV